MARTDHTAFTLVFDGSIRGKPNPLTTETPFGTAFTASVGDVVEENVILREALRLAASRLENVGEHVWAEDALNHC